jgi:hypothetical protein
MFGEQAGKSQASLWRNPRFGADFSLNGGLG